jgi:site-specific DNA-methyltransferase (adenine-specific)/modification methylase
MPTLPDKSVDVIITDPPYNLSAYSTGNIKMNWRGDFNNDIALWDKIPFDPIMVKDQFLRIIKPTGTIFSFCTYNQLGRWHEIYDPIFDTFQIMVWHKTNPPPKLRRQGFLNSCELIVAMWNKGHTWNFTKQSEMHNFIESGICQGKERLDHPTQKPVKVLKRLVELASLPGQTIYDPYMGVGSTGEAALSLGRKFIGVENYEPHFNNAVKRLAEKFPPEEKSA